MRLLVLSLVIVAAVACVRPEEPVRPALLPDVGAAPSLVAVNVNSARRATLRNADLVTNLVNGLPSSTRFLVLTNDRSAFTVARNDRPERIQFLEVPIERSTTIWTQDPFLVLSDGRDVTLLASRDFERADDRIMADVIAQAAGYRVTRSGLFFEGGNIVSDAEHVFIGANTIRRNAIELKLPEEEVVLRFQEELGRRVLVVGPVPQPIAHIDMMLTPLGDGVLALADVTAGALLAERALDGAPESVAAFESWTEAHFFGHPRIRQVSGRDGAITAPHLRGRTREMIERSYALAPVLDEVARSLEGHGYRVVRIPMLMGGPETDASPSDEGEYSMNASYPMLTYNNVLLEAGANGKRVYVPRYGFAALDDAAHRKWEAVGFAPRPVDGLTISSMYGGALRCAVKVLRR